MCGGACPAPGSHRRSRVQAWVSVWGRRRAHPGYSLTGLAPGTAHVITMNTQGSLNVCPRKTALHLGLQGWALGVQGPGRSSPRHKQTGFC